MYLTAQHIRRTATGAEDWHAYLHLHDIAPNQSFPHQAPLSVPEQHPGLLVFETPRQVRPGGNRILSYLDIIADDAEWLAIPPWSSKTTSDYWTVQLKDIGELMAHGGYDLPWTVDAGPVHTIFNADREHATIPEFLNLLQTAMSVWEGWRARFRLP